MPKQYDNNMRGVVFINQDKIDMLEKTNGDEREKVSKWADRRGSCEINRVEYWISGWIKESKKGETFLSLSFQEKEDKNDDHKPSEKKSSPKKERDPF